MSSNDISLIKYVCVPNPSSDPPPQPYPMPQAALLACCAAGARAPFAGYPADRRPHTQIYVSLIAIIANLSFSSEFDFQPPPPPPPPPPPHDTASLLQAALRACCACVRRPLFLHAEHRGRREQPERPTLDASGPQIYICEFIAILRILFSDHTPPTQPFLRPPCARARVNPAPSTCVYCYC